MKLLYHLSVGAIILASGFMIGSIITTMSDPRTPQCYQGNPENWTDFVVTHNCEAQIKSPPQTKGLIIQISPDPVWWKCDNGWFYY